MSSGLLIHQQNPVEAIDFTNHTCVCIGVDQVGVGEEEAEDVDLQHALLRSTQPGGRQVLGGARGNFVWVDTVWLSFGSCLATPVVLHGCRVPSPVDCDPYFQCHERP